MSNEPASNPPVDVDINVGNQDPAPNQDLPTEQPPKGPDQNRGRDDKAREAAPGQQKKDDDEG